VAKIGKTAG